MVMEVYQIIAWLPTYSTMHSFCQSKETIEKDKGGYEFVGVIVDEVMRKKYVGKW